MIILHSQCYFHADASPVCQEPPILSLGSLPVTLKVLTYIQLRLHEFFHRSVPGLSLGSSLVMHYCGTNSLETALSNTCILSGSSIGFGSVVPLLHLMSAGATTSWRCKWAETFRMIPALGWVTPDVIWELFWSGWMEHQHVLSTRLGLIAWWPGSEKRPQRGGECKLPGRLQTGAGCYTGNLRYILMVRWS